jgi:beta-1,2-mannobiose phosphorylase / 1,2-beta-oligomannan phosphorylase
MREPLRFEVIADETMHVHAREPLASFYQLSPYVWRTDAGFEVMLRAVPHSDDPAQKVARIYHGRSSDGLAFHMDDEPAIAPGPEPEDRDGCEDPTVAVVSGTTYVYYTGWNQMKHSGCLMLASGPDASQLVKRGASLQSRPGIANPKEAEIALAEDASWRLFFEYADQDASRIGLAASGHVDGPWNVGAPPFERRPANWDAWHLSTGPTVVVDGTPVMFYNGATRDAKWRIGWIRFDAAYTHVLERCDDPLIAPPAPKGDDTDIAFAASALCEGDLIHVYYSVADRYVRRATVLRR